MSKKEADTPEIRPRVTDEILEQMKRLTEALGDNEVSHSIYDDIVYSIAYDANPNLVKQLDDIVKDEDFWYA